MSTLGKIQKVIDSEPELNRRTDEPRWQALCVCGHLEQHHSASVGGSHPVESDGMPYQLDGCTGAMRQVGRRRALRDSTGRVGDRTQFQVTEAGPANVVPVTCPCREFRPVAEVDRLGGRFRQRPHATGHPFLSGMRGMVKTVEKMAADRDIEPEELFEARFRWTVPLTCERCASTEDVFPGWTVPGKESGLLCVECRDKARATLIL